MKDDMKKFLELSLKSIGWDLLLEICATNLALRRREIFKADSNKEKRNEILKNVWETVRGILWNVGVEMGMEETPESRVFLSARLSNILDEVEASLD